MRSGGFTWVTVYATAMAYLEAAVVVYLRRVFGVTDLLQDEAVFDPRIASTEIVREAATLLMIVSVGCIAGRSRQARLGFILFAFGLWDVLYYVWLKILLGWPDSLLTQDILFLIPLPWWGPVIAPVLVALLAMAAGVLLVRCDERGRTIRFSPPVLWLLLGGVLLVLYSFMADALRALPADPAELSRLKPTAFSWPLYLVGLGAMAGSIWQAARASTR